MANRVEKCVACKKSPLFCSCKPPNPRAEVCGACGNWIFVLGQICEWDERDCAPRKKK